MSEQGVSPGTDEAAPIDVATGPEPTGPGPSRASAGIDDADPAPGVAAAPAEPATPGRSRARMIVLGSLLVVVLLVVGAFALAGLRVLRQKDATLTTPDEVAGLRRDDSAQAVATADYLRTALAAEVDLEETVGTVYADPASGGPTVLLFGGTTLFWTPGRDLDTAFELLSDDTGPVAGVTEVPSGSLGGVMKCGDASQDGAMAVCGWADHGSIALAMFPGRTPADAAPLMRDVRAAIQRRT